MNWFLDNWQLTIGLAIAGIVLLVVGYYYLQFYMFRSKVNTGKDLVGVKDIPYVPFFAPKRNELRGPKTSFLKNVGSKIANNPIVREQAKKAGNKAKDRALIEARRRAENNPRTKNVLDKSQQYRQSLNAPTSMELRSKQMNEIKTELKSLDRTELRDLAESMQLSTSGSKTQIRNRIYNDIQRDKNRGHSPGSNDSFKVGELKDLNIDKTAVEYSSDGKINKARVYLVPNAPKIEWKNTKREGSIITAIDIDEGKKSSVIAKTPFQIKEAHVDSLGDGTIVVDGKNLGGRDFQFFAIATPRSPINFIKDKIGFQAPKHNKQFGKYNKREIIGLKILAVNLDGIDEENWSKKNKFTRRKNKNEALNFIVEHENEMKSYLKNEKDRKLIDKIITNGSISDMQKLKGNLYREYWKNTADNYDIEVNHLHSYYYKRNKGYKEFYK